jgi:hypothetical protein
MATKNTEVGEFDSRCSRDTFVNPGQPMHPNCYRPIDIPLVDQRFLFGCFSTFFLLLLAAFIRVGLKFM